MPVGRLHILGNAKVTAVSGGAINPTSLTFTIADPTGWPTGGVNGKFPVVVNRNRANEEHMLAESRTGNTITIASLADRGLDGTTAGDHDLDSEIYHGFLGIQADEANQHVNDVAADHHTQYMKADGTRHDLTARHLVGVTVPAGNPIAFAIADTMNQGGSTSAAKADHRHAGPGWGTPVSIGTANAAGSATTVPHSDHVHELGVGSIDNVAFFADAVISNAAKFSSGLQPWITSSSDPGAVGANRMWIDTTNRAFKVRNAANSAWEEWWNVGAWAAYTPTITGFNLGTGTKYGRYKKLGVTVIAEFGFTIGTGASSTGVPLQVSLPINASDPGLGAAFNWIGAGRAFKPGAGGGRFASVGIINPSSSPGTIQSFATAGQDPWDNDSPFSPWTDGTVFNGFAAYEVPL